MWGKFKNKPSPAGDGGVSMIEPLISVIIRSAVEDDTAAKSLAACIATADADAFALSANNEPDSTALDANSEPEFTALSE